MKYVDECEFCRIIVGKESARVVFESATTLAFLPLRPAVIGHTLLIPKTHVTDFLNLDDRQLATDLAIATVHVGQALRRALRPDGMNAITSAGEAATQTVSHLHIHLVPRRYGDAMGDIWPRTKEWPDEMEEERIAELVRHECGSGFPA